MCDGITLWDSKICIGFALNSSSLISSLSGLSQFRLFPLNDVHVTLAKKYFKQNKAVLKVGRFGSGRKIKSINFLAEVELKMFFSSLLGKDREERIYMLPENQAELVESFLKVMHLWERIFFCRAMFVYSFRQCFSVRGCRAALPWWLPPVNNGSFTKRPCKG